MRYRILLLLCVLLRLSDTRAQQLINDHEAARILPAAHSPLNPEVASLLGKAETSYQKLLSDSSAAGNARSYAQQALAASERSRDIKGRGRSYLLLAKIAQQEQAYESGIVYAGKAMDIFRTLKEPDLLGESYVMLWSTNSCNGLALKDRIPFLEKAVAAFHEAGNNMREGDCCKELGDLLFNTDSAARAIAVLNRSLVLHRQAGKKDVQGAYDLLNGCYFSLGDAKTAIRYGLMALKTMAETGDTGIAVATYYNRIGIAYLQLRDFGRAGQYWDKALRHAERFHQPETIFYIVGNKVNLLTKTGDLRGALATVEDIQRRYPQMRGDPYRVFFAFLLVPVYLGLNRYGDARAESILIEKSLPDHKQERTQTLTSYKMLVTYNLAVHNLEKAARYNKLYQQFATDAANHTSLAASYSFQFRIDSARGNFQSAIRNYQRYIAIKDTLFNAEKAKAIDQLTILYETEQKEKDNQLLKKETQLQAASIRQAAVLQRATSAGLAVLALIVAGLVYGYISKQRTNRKLRQQKEEIDQKNLSLQNLINEKEWLVKEIHHRVKNNLHMVMGLLASKTEFVKSDEAYDAMVESQHRVQAMSLIHQRLYQTENMSSIDMRLYVLELVNYLQSSFDKSLPVQFKLDIADVAFSLSHSIPIGLILNEAITNAMKYAFPGGRSGTISISLKTANSKDFFLIVQDDGIGIPDSVNLSGSSSLGMTLIHGLSDDIGGNLKITTFEGVRIELSFTLPGYGAGTEQA